VKYSAIEAIGAPLFGGADLTRATPAGKSGNDCGPAIPL